MEYYGEETPLKDDPKSYPKPWEYALLNQGLGAIQSFLNLMSVKDRIEKMKEYASSHNFNRTKFEQDCEFLAKTHKENLQFQIKSVKSQLEHIKEQQDFQFFCERFWLPLFKMTVNSLELPLKELLDGSVKNLRIQLMVAWTPSLQKNLSSLGINTFDNYNEFCQELKSRFSGTHVFSTSFINGWQKCSTGTSSDTMLLYYVMRGIPSVVLYFKEEFGYVSVEAAFWGLSGGINEFSTTKLLELPLPDSNKIEFISELMYSAAALIGDTMRKGILGSKFELRETLSKRIKSPIIYKIINEHYEIIHSHMDNPIFDFIN